MLASYNWKRLFAGRSSSSRRVSLSSALFLGQTGTGNNSRRAKMDLNPFRLCSGLQFLGYFMILLVLAITALSYYAVVILSWGPHLLDGGSSSLLSFFIVIVFHILSFSDPGSVPENWKLVSQQNIEEGISLPTPNDMAHGNSALTSSSGGLARTEAVRFCNQCQNGKPPRCHHCSICQRCVLKMDHHCIWVVNCVGAHNYKFFLLFVSYTFLETTMDTLVLLPNFINFFQQAKHHSLSPGNLAVTFLAFVLNLAFALSLLCFVIMHASPSLEQHYFSGGLREEKNHKMEV